jgi:hypothetical protein
MVTPLKMVALAPMVAPRLISVFSYRQLAQAQDLSCPRQSQHRATHRGARLFSSRQSLIGSDVFNLFARPIEVLIGKRLSSPATFRPSVVVID